MATAAVIEDDFHAEWHGEYSSVVEAFAELKVLAAIAWDQPPNKCPCTGWRTCHRYWKILVYDDTSTPWTELEQLGCLEVSSEGAIWHGDFENGCLNR